MGFAVEVEIEQQQKSVFLELTNTQLHIPNDPKNKTSTRNDLTRSNGLSTSKLHQLHTNTAIKQKDVFIHLIEYPFQKNVQLLYIRCDIRCSHVYLWLININICTGLAYVSNN